jgi:putative nucleotidyltransferase with HDIG domain
MLAFVLGRVPAVLRRQAVPSRLVHAAGNSWFAIGPAAVFVAAETDPWNAGPALLLLALGAQFAVDLGSSAARDAIESGTSLREQLSEAWVYGVDAALSPVALAIAYTVHEHPIAVVALLPLLSVFASFARERRARLEGLLELKDAYQGTALVLGDVVEADDGYTGEHCKSVVRLALEVGSHVGLDSDRLRNLEFGALLHDVGKVAIPKAIINKPGKLDPHEWTIIKTHTVEGQRMLDRVGGFMRTVGLIVRSHHERWDGGGYPDGLWGEEIPLESRIIACCDSWNAMRTNRPYRKALPHDVAVTELVDNAGRQFDPSIVEALLEVVGQEEPVLAPKRPRPSESVNAPDQPAEADSASRLLLANPPRGGDAKLEVSPGR